MVSPNLFQFPARVFWMIFFLILLTAVVSSSGELSMYVSEPTILKLSSGSLVENSPGSRSGAMVVCERIHIHGLSRARLHNLRKYAHSMKVNVKVVDKPRARLPNAEVCFHGNMSLGVGMCPQRQWEKLTLGSWIHLMSPYDNKLLDIRMSGSSLEIIEVSSEEEFLLYRVILLVLGIIMLAMAPCLSKSIAFYYSGAMAVGVILVVLMVLFQGMKLLPTGRKNSLAIVIYSSLVGVGSFILRYLPGLLHSLLVEIGISDDMYTPLSSLLLVCIILAGAWLGFWVVRKLVLTEDGSVDLSVANFVAWSIRILSAAMIFQSSLDPLLSTAALVSGILVLSVTRRIIKSRFLHHLHKSLRHKSKRNNHLKSSRQNSPAIDPTKTPPQRLSDSETYFSIIHDTPERKKFSKEEWEIFTKDSTKKALEELVSSPDFSKWAVRNAERITLAPPQNSNTERRSRWLPWF